MTGNLNVSGKAIDFKSLLIGFLLASVVFLGINAYSGSDGVQDVRIVAIRTSDNLPVRIDSVGYYTTIPVEIEKVDSSIKIPVEIKDVNYSLEIPVKIKDQPISVTSR